MFSKKYSTHAPGPLCRKLTFAKMPAMEKPRKELTARHAKMERSALRAVTNLTGVKSTRGPHQLACTSSYQGVYDPIQLEQHIEKTQKSKLIQRIFLHSVDLQEPYTALIDMGII